MLGYIDGDWASDIVKQRSTLAYVFNFGSRIFLLVIKETVGNTLSTSKVKYIIGNSGTTQMYGCIECFFYLKHTQEVTTKILLW